MKLSQLMEINVHSLAEAQHNELKKYVVEKLQSVINLIEKENYTDVSSLLFYSPAGDGYGCENHCIDFKFSEESLDIQEVVNMLINLKEMQ